MMHFIKISIALFDFTLNKNYIFTCNYDRFVFVKENSNYLKQIFQNTFIFRYADYTRISWLQVSSPLTDLQNAFCSNSPQLMQNLWIFERDNRFAATPKRQSNILMMSLLKMHKSVWLVSCNIKFKFHTSGFCPRVPIEDFFVLL